MSFGGKELKSYLGCALHHERCSELYRVKMTQKVPKAVNGIGFQNSRMMWLFGDLSTAGGLGPDDVLTVLEELRKVRAKWENIGLGLDVAPGTLEAIKLQYQDPLDCLREVLREWLKSLPGPSWEGLVQVLRRPAIGEQSLARELVTKFCSQSETLESPPGIQHL